MAGKGAVEGKKKGGAVNSSRNPGVLPTPEHLSCHGSPRVGEASGDPVSAAVTGHALRFALLWGTVWTAPTCCFDNTVMMPRAHALLLVPFGVLDLKRQIVRFQSPCGLEGG